MPEPHAQDPGFTSIQRLFGEMLEDGRHAFDAAANALVGGTDPDVVRADLFATDRRINATEQKLRRQLVVHGSVHGGVHLPHLLILMSLAKDAERIGDYAKNIFDLAVVAPWLGDDAQRARLVELKDSTSRLLVRAKAIYDTEDVKDARIYLSECDKLQDEFDAIARECLVLEGRNATGRALAARYLKRVVSHAGNIVTSIVMPLDKLDFFDED